MNSLIKQDRDLLPAFSRDFFDTDLFNLPSFFQGDGARLKWPDIPSVNIVENNKDYRIEVAAPGLEKKDFKIEVDNGILTIRSEKKKEEKEEKENYRRREFSYQSFSRSFDLPENSVPDKIGAHYSNGILTVTLPKKEITVSKPKKEIQVS